MSKKFGVKVQNLSCEPMMRSINYDEVLLEVLFLQLGNI